jgi:hypothetical protein
MTVSYLKPELADTLDGSHLVVCKGSGWALGFSEDWLLLYNNNHGKDQQAGPT